MAPYESPDLSVAGGLGIATCVLQDIGWRLADGVHCPGQASRVEADASQGRIAAPPATGDAAGADGDNDSNNSGGGGCTMAPASRFAPVWALLLGLAVGVLAWRRRRGHPAGDVRR